MQSGALMLGAQGGRFALRIVSTVVLARMLSPDDYGLVAMVAAISMTVNVLREGGLSSATVQRPRISHAQVSGLFWLNVLLGAGAMLLLVALAPVISWFYGRPELVFIAFAFAGIGLIGSLALQHEALLQRRMEFKRLAARDLIAHALGTTAGIVSAALGARYWSLIIMEAMTAAALVAGAWMASPWRPSPPRRLEGFGSLVRFGANVTGANLVGQFSRGLDAICLGYFFGAASLGFYNRAQNVLATPLRQVVTPVVNVARPALSRAAEQTQRFSEATSELLSLIAFSTALVVAVVLPASDWFIAIVLGPAWSSSVPIFAALAPFAFIEPCASLLSTVLVASGKPEILLRWKLVSVAIIGAGLLAGLPWGPIGVAASFAASGLLLRTPLFMWYVSRHTGLRFQSMIEATVPAVGAGMASAALAWVSRGALPEMSPIVGCLVVGPLAGVLYLGFCAFTAEGRLALSQARRVFAMLVEGSRPSGPSGRGTSRTPG